MLLSVYLRVYFRPDNPRRRSLVASGAHRECRLKINPVARNTPPHHAAPRAARRLSVSESGDGAERRVTCNVCTKIAAISRPETEVVSDVRPPTRRAVAVVANELLSSPLDPAYCSPILILTARRYAGRWHRENTRRTCDAGVVTRLLELKLNLFISPFFPGNFNFVDAVTHVKFYSFIYYLTLHYINVSLNLYFVINFNQLYKFI